MRRHRATDGVRRCAPISLPVRRLAVVRNRLVRDGSEGELRADQSYWLAPDAPALMPLAADGALIAPVLLPASAPAPLLLSARLQPAPPIVSIAIAVITMTFLKFGFIAESPAWFGVAAKQHAAPPQRCNKHAHRCVAKMRFSYGLRCFAQIATQRKNSRAHVFSSINR
jgi:hypothetical protein